MGRAAVLLRREAEELLGHEPHGRQAVPLATAGLVARDAVDVLLGEAEQIAVLEPQLIGPGQPGGIGDPLVQR